MLKANLFCLHRQQSARHDVRILRLSGGGEQQQPSPILLVKDYGRDRGARLARLACVSAAVDQALDGKSGDLVSGPTNAGRHGGPQLRGAPARLVQEQANAVLQLCDQALQREPGAEARRARRALRQRAPYVLTSLVVYAARGSMRRHVDGAGGWLVLFSLGLSVDFHVDGEALLLESGDALVFNGSALHDVEHGVDRVCAEPSLAGAPAPLPDELSAVLRGTRVTVQARQGPRKVDLKVGHPH